MKINTIILTLDRSPRKNYLASTLDSLKNSGLLEHPSFKLTVHHSGKPQSNIDQANVHSSNLNILKSAQKHDYNSAILKSLRHACTENPDYILFMEDDIEVCPDFPEFVIATLKEFGASPAMDFCTSFQEINIAYQQGKRSIEMHSEKFYGTQCFAMTIPDAQSFALFIEHNKNHKEGFADTWFDSWLQAADRPRVMKHAVPSAAQHKGVDSSLDHNFFNVEGFQNDLEEIVPKPNDTFLTIDSAQEGHILRHIKTAEKLHLNDTAHLIYLHCDGQMSLKQIINKLHEGSDLNRSILSAHIRQTLAALHENGVIDY